MFKEISVNLKKMQMYTFPSNIINKKTQSKFALNAHFDDKSRVDCRNCKFNIKKQIPSLDECTYFRYLIGYNHEPLIYTNEYSSVCRMTNTLCGEMGMYFQPKISNTTIVKNDEFK